MIIDVVFTVVLALAGANPDGTVSIDNATFGFPTRTACMSFRGERIDYVNSKTDAEKKGFTFYISECMAVPVAVITK
jgi:hypothetical protein